MCFVYIMFQLGFILVQTGHHHSMSLKKGVIRFCVSSNAFAVHCHFDVKCYLHSTTYFPLPPSHTTYSVVLPNQCNLWFSSYPTTLTMKIPYKIITEMALCRDFLLTAMSASDECALSTEVLNTFPYTVKQHFVQYNVDSTVQTHR